jgi:hypothetical protein
MSSHKEIKKRDFVYIIKSILRRQILRKIDLINISNLRLRKSALFLFDCFRIIILTRSWFWWCWFWRWFWWCWFWCWFWWFWCWFWWCWLERRDSVLKIVLRREKFFSFYTAEWKMNLEKWWTKHDDEFDRRLHLLDRKKWDFVDFRRSRLLHFLLTYATVFVSNIMRFFTYCAFFLDDEHLTNAFFNDLNFRIDRILKSKDIDFRCDHIVSNYNIAWFCSYEKIFRTCEFRRLRRDVVEWLRWSSRRRWISARRWFIRLRRERLFSIILCKQFLSQSILIFSSYLHQSTFRWRSSCCDRHEKRKCWFWQNASKFQKFSFVFWFWHHTIWFIENVNKETSRSSFCKWKTWYFHIEDVEKSEFDFSMNY